MKDLSWKVRIYIFSIILVGVGLTVFNLINIDWGSYWMLILAVIAAIAQVYKAEGTTQKSSYNLAWAVYGFSLVLMGGPATLFIILVAHLVDWAWHRYPWYVQMYNMATFAITASATAVLYNWILAFDLPAGLLNTLAILIALTSFTLVNHLIIGMVIWFARGQNLKQSGVFSILPLMIDISLLAIGMIAALIWTINPSAIVVVIIPLYLIYNTLRVPSLQRQTEIDPKTKLYNSDYFKRALDKEFDRAVRYDRPLTLAIGDLDLLRNINNTYGHLAGDIVLVKVAEILQEQFDEYDLVARFGGEEFTILMPETSADEAFPRVEAVRQSIASANYEVSTSVTPIKASISFGIATLDCHDSAENLIHDADVTLYRSKLMGRNMTCIYSSSYRDEVINKLDVESPVESTQQINLNLLHSGSLY